MTPAIASMAAAVRVVMSWIAAILPVMSLVACAVSCARSLTSEATTAKPLPASPAPGGLDRGVQREQIGLPGDGGDQPDDVADLPAGLAERGDQGRGGGGVRAGGGRGGRGVHGLPGDLADGGRQLPGRRRHVGDRTRYLPRRAVGAACLPGGLLRRRV